MDNTQKSCKILSLFSGYGGIERGLEITGITPRVLAHVEIESFAIANMVAKMEEGKMGAAPIWTNAKTFDARPFRGMVDILTGGFPCQPFSSAGGRNADEDPRHLFPSVRRIAEECRPEWIFLENVEGILSAKLGGDGWSDPKGTPVLLHVLRELERLGYRATAGVFSAEECQAPHRRKRVFILANREVDNTISERSHGQLRNPQNIEKGWEEATRSTTTTSFSSVRWPARPRQPQHEWEAPRVVANPNYKGLQGSVPNREPHSEPRFQQTDGLPTRCSDIQSGIHGESVQGILSKPELGGANDGNTCWVDPITNRVDRLRMIGNGVVPQTAALAWETLTRRLLQNEN